MKKKYESLINLGCRLNIFEGEVIKSFFNSSDDLDYSIINSCAVTEKAEKKVQYEIRRLKKKFPNKKIVVTGCAAQINPKYYESLPEVDFVIGNIEKIQKVTWDNLSKNSLTQVGNIFENEYINENIVKKFEGKSRAYIEIQQGCNHRCTFCIIPYGRGNNRSIPVGLIIKRIKELVQNKYKEFVLTGVDITDYGKDLPGAPNLFQLIKRILNLIPEIEQLRLSSIDCGEISEDFWKILNNKKLMPHFHISLQSGNDIILKRMKRRHTRKDIIEFCKKVKNIRKDAVFGADIIAGFPTENNEMFEDSLKLIKECNLTHLHIFPYSKRNGTPASKMPQIPISTIYQRAEKLRKEGKENLSAYLKKQIGKTTSMLVEKNDIEGSYGKTKHFTKIFVNKIFEEGTIIDCKILHVNNNVLHAEII